MSEFGNEQELILLRFRERLKSSSIRPGTFCVWVFASRWVHE